MSERLNVRRTRRPEIPTRARFEPTKKKPGDIELTPGGFVKIGPDDDAVSLDEEVS